MGVHHYVYEISDVYTDWEYGGGTLFASEEAALKNIREAHAKATGDWTEERHKNGDLVVRFREVTPVRRLYRHLWEWCISAVEVQA